MSEAAAGRKNAHDYKAKLIWDGNLGAGTSTYTGYGRKYRVKFDGKPDLPGSADPIFKGDANVYNPEDLFVASLSSCHLLSYLALCARSKIKSRYEDDASGTMVSGLTAAANSRAWTPAFMTLARGTTRRSLRVNGRPHMCFIARREHYVCTSENQNRRSWAAT